MKKTISLLMASSLALGGISAYASNDVTVNLDGKKMSFDVNPFIENGRTLVPMRAMFEAVGASVTWNQDSKTIIVAQEKDSAPKFITLQIDNQTAFINSEKTELDVPARIVNDTTFVPLRFVMNELGADVTWDSATYTVNIKTK